MSKHKLRIYTKYDVTERFFPRNIKTSAKTGKPVYNNKPALQAFSEGRIIGVVTKRNKGGFVTDFTITPSEWRRLCAYGVQAPVDHNSQRVSA